MLYSVMSHCKVQQQATDESAQSAVATIKAEE
jgi:hypothetical protein